MHRMRNGSQIENAKASKVIPSVPVLPLQENTLDTKLERSAQTLGNQQRLATQIRHESGIRDIDMNTH